jgi:hypothetical protein
MNTLGKILTSFVTLAFAIIGGLWTAYTVLTTTIESKIAHSEASMRIERSAQIGEVAATVDGLKLQLNSMDNKLNILIQRDK